MLARFPNLLWGANPYAEEGVVYYAYATEHSLVSTLAFRFNYYSLVANMAAAVEAALPISLLRWVSPLVGLIGPTIVVLLIARQRRPRWRVALAIAVTVFTISMEREWYSVIHAQFWFAAAVVVLIGAFGLTPGQRRTDYAIACVAGLSGLIAVMAVPGLIAETVRRRHDRVAARHLATVTLLLVATSVVNRLAAVARSRSMPFADLIPTTFLKVIWQPITGGAGNAVGQRLLTSSALTANLIGIAGFVVVGAVLALVLRGRWLISAITAVFVSAGAIVFSLPPASNLATTLGGRYGLVGAVPLGVALAMGATRRGGLAHDLVDRFAVGERLANLVPNAQRLALFASLIWVCAAVYAGWLTSTWLRDSDLDNTANFVTSVHELGPHHTGTVQVEGVCRVAPNPVATRAGLSVDTEWQADGSLRIEVESAGVDAGQPVGVFVWATKTDQNFRVDPSGNQRIDGYTYGIFNEDLPGTCYPFNDDVAPSATFTDRSVIVIPAGSFDGLDPNAFVRVGVGRSINDALALHTFRFVGLVADAEPIRDSSRD